MARINSVPQKKGGPRGMAMPKQKLKNPKQTLKKLLGYIGKYKGAFIFVFICCLITTGISVIATRVSGNIIDKYINRDVVDLSGLARVCVIMLSVYVVHAILNFTQSKIMVKVSQDTTFTMRQDLFEKVQLLPLRYYDTNSSGDLMSRLTNDVDNVNNAMSQTITQLISNVISIFGMLIAMFVTSWQLTLVGLATTPIMLVIMRSLLKISQPIFVRQQKILGELNGFSEENISGQKAVILFDRREKTNEEFQVKNRAMTSVAVMSNCLGSLMGPLNNFIANFTYLLVCVVGATFTVRNIGGITVGIIYSFIIYLKNFNRPINEIFNLMTMLQSAFAGAERVFEVIDEKPEQDADDSIELTDVKGDVELSHVFFGYDENETILKDVSLHASVGETVAIVGHTGAGKTTIINLLTKFYDINDGTITIDGQDICKLTRKSVRENISIVLQDTFLFNESVRENLKYARPSASNEEIEAAAKQANAHHFIMALPDGYDTVLSDNGANISQGQRQLLAIARALLADSAILILDEATSSIDTKTEVEIQRAMLELMKGRTSFVIAHRLSTIKNADQILLLDAGRIVERGTHDDLLAAGGAYAELYNSQFSDEE